MKISSEEGCLLTQAKWLMVTVAPGVLQDMQCADIDDPETAATVVPLIRLPRAEVPTAGRYESPPRPWKHVVAVAATLVLAASGGAR